jgi:adenosylcobinamide kinase / adenosylcobinamide-phosphate guanylyltransferase
LTGRLLFIIGGARSGKSRFAVERAAEQGGAVLFVATGVSTDEEMAERIARHREERPADWATIEVRYELAPAIKSAWSGQPTVLLDDISAVVSNLLVERSVGEVEVRSEIEALVALTQAPSFQLIIVSSELGLGLVPPTRLGRQCRDLLGVANQIVAAAADEVVLMMAGIPLSLKGRTP